MKLLLSLGRKTRIIALKKTDHLNALFYKNNVAKQHAYLISILTSLTAFLVPSTKKNAVFLSKCGVLSYNQLCE